MEKEYGRGWRRRPMPPWLADLCERVRHSDREVRAGVGRLVGAFAAAEDRWEDDWSNAVDRTEAIDYYAALHGKLVTAPLKALAARDFLRTHTGCSWCEHHEEFPALGERCAEATEAIRAIERYRIALGGYLGDEALIEVFERYFGHF